MGLSNIKLFLYTSIEQSFAKNVFKKFKYTI